MEFSWQTDRVTKNQLISLAKEVGVRVSMNQLFHPSILPFAMFAILHTVVVYLIGRFTV